MASSVNREECIQCEQGLGIMICGGCQEWFCAKHFSEHREELTTKMDDISEDIDFIQNAFIERNSTHPRLVRIDQWEQQSITKIRAEAEEARNDLRKSLTQTKDQIKTGLYQLTKDLESSRKSDDYTEIELDKWKNQLKEFRMMLDERTFVDIFNADDDEQIEPLIQFHPLEESQTSFLYEKEQPNELKVANGISSPNSIIGLSPEKMNELKMSRGDLAFIKGKKNHETIGIINAYESCPNDCILINRALQKNIGVRSGNLALIRPCKDIKYGKRIHLKSTSSDNQKKQSNLFQIYLRPHFLDSYRPVCKGDKFIARTKEQSMEFEVIETDPDPYCIVAPDTVIICDGQAYQIIKKMKKRS